MTIIQRRKLIANFTEVHQLVLGWPISIRPFRSDCTGLETASLKIIHHKIGIGIARSVFPGGRVVSKDERRVEQYRKYA